MDNRTKPEVPSWPIVFQSLYNELLLALKRDQEGDREPVLNTAKKCVSSVKLSMTKLREEVIRIQFLHLKDEILFFKHIKPLFHRHLIFWAYVSNIELLRPVGGKDEVRSYFQRELNKLNYFFASQSGFYLYCRNGETMMDEIYFLRDKQDYSTTNPHSVDNDRSFSTSHDYLVAKILANEMLLDYLTNEMDNLEQGKLMHPAKPVSSLQWTASKAGLVELIYALQSVGVYNNGTAEIKEIAQLFEMMFQVDLGNYYHTFNEIRLRKKNRAQLLDQMKEKLVKKMDEMDER